MSKIRHYSPSTDHDHVIEICKDVYGGFDALPRTINSYLTQPDTYQPDTYIYACADDEEDTLQALICVQLRGGVFYIWGARTREAFQGKGLGKLLLRHVEAEAHRNYSSNTSSIKGFLSTTITENAPMRRIFNTNGYVEHCLVDIVSLTPENIKIVKDKACDHNGTARSLNLQPCTSATELPTALKTLRNHTKPTLDSTESINSNNCSAIPIEWLPGEYIPWPVESDQVTSFIKEKKVFLLSSTENDTPSSTNSSTNIEAVIFMGIGDHGTPFAGIVAASWPSLVAAVDRALELESECSRLYIDRCGAIEKEYLETEFGGGLRDYIVVYKPFSK